MVNLFKTSTMALSAAAAAAVLMTGCGGSSGGGSSSVENCDSSVIDVVLKGDITGQTLDATKTYGLDGKVRLTSGELVVPAGTTFAGCTASSYFLVKPGAQITAVGTQAQPITFTSQVDLLGQSHAGSTGEWGGLIILGNAFTDHGVTQYEAGDAEDTFGRSDHLLDTESSGTLEYVLVKHTGFKVNEDKELNGLSLGGVGSGTSISNIAIIGGSDDGLELWGGRVDIDGIYVYNAKDDSLDTDLGYRGTIRNAYAVQYIVDKTNNHDSAIFETGNDENTLTVGNSDATQPIYENVTGVVKGAGIYMKNDAGIQLNNIVLTSAKAYDDTNASEDVSQLVTYRTADVVTTNAMHAASVCMNLTTTNSTNPVEYFYNMNTKDTSTTQTAYTDWTTNTALNSSYTLGSTSGCTGATIASVWKGKAGSNEPLE